MLAWPEEAAKPTLLPEATTRVNIRPVSPDRGYQFSLWYVAAYTERSAHFFGTQLIRTMRDYQTFCFELADERLQEVDMWRRDRSSELRSDVRRGVDNVGVYGRRPTHTEKTAEFPRHDCIQHC